MGDIWIIWFLLKLFSCDSCGVEDQTSCSSLFNKTKSIPSYKQIASWNTAIKVGYNKYELLKPFPVKKGNYLGFSLTNSARIALNTNENLTYFDFEWKLNTKGLTNLPVKAARFYFNAIINSYYYKTLSLFQSESLIDQYYQVIVFNFRVLNSSYSVNKSIIYSKIILAIF